MSSSGTKQNPDSTCGMSSSCTSTGISETGTLSFITHQTIITTTEVSKNSHSEMWEPTRRGYTPCPRSQYECRAGFEHRPRWLHALLSSPQFHCFEGLLVMAKVSCFYQGQPEALDRGPCGYQDTRAACFLSLNDQGGNGSALDDDWR